MIDWRPIQRKLDVTPDGIDGPATYGALFGKIIGRDLGAVGRTLGIGARVHLAAHGIDTSLRLAHWVAQAAHENAFRYWHEIWGPTPVQLRYEGRQDLGNTVKGDGFLYRGRGIFQLTGRANYRRFGRQLGIDLEASPELAADPALSVLIAARYWADRDMNVPADADDVEGVTRKINGGVNGLGDRKVMLARAKAILL